MCDCRFRADMQLVWANALLYNGKESAIGRQALAGRRRFEEAWIDEFRLSPSPHNVLLILLPMAGGSCYCTARLIRAAR